MRILIASDKFKGSLTAQEVGEALRRGLLRRYPETEVILHPMADGGDGSLDLLRSHLPLQDYPVETVDPLGRPLASFYAGVSSDFSFTSVDRNDAINSTAGATGNNGVALVELAHASGIVLLQEAEKNPLLTSTFGSGLVMRQALEAGFQRQYLFLGGSATNDAGMGIAVAFGYRFLDGGGQAVAPSGGQLGRIREIVPPTTLPELQLTLLCDVDNPLYGPQGAARVYARQKGASDAEIEQLDAGLQHFAELLHKATGQDVSQLAGGGAAGGIPAGLAALLQAQIQLGFRTLAQLTHLEQAIQSADWVISGEGRLDRQSLQGKVPAGVAELCRQYGKPLTLVVGKNELDQAGMEELGVKEVLSVLEVAGSVEEAMQNGGEYLEELGGGL